MTRSSSKANSAKTPHDPVLINCINRFCGKGKTYEQLQDAIAILKNPKSTERKVLCAPTVMLLMEWSKEIKEAVGEKIFKERCGRLFNITPEQISNMALLLGENHSSVKTARALKESSKSSISENWTVILTTHSTGWSRINDFGWMATVFFDEIPLDILSFHNLRGKWEYDAMLSLREKKPKHSAFSKATALAKQLEEGRIDVHFYTHTQESEEGKEAKVTDHAVQFWNLKFAKVKSITFMSAMADKTFLPLLAKLNGIEIAGIMNPKAFLDMKAAMKLITFRSDGDLGLRCSKAAHYKEEDIKRSQNMLNRVRALSGFIVGFKGFESECNRNVRFGLAGLNTLSSITTVGIDGLPRFSPEVLSGVKSILGDKAGAWIKGFMFQSIVQSLWRSAIRKGEKIDVLVWSSDVPELFSANMGERVSVFSTGSETWHTGVLM